MSQNSAASVAAGHGRNWGQGAVTGCYGPLLLGTREVAGAVVPLLEVEGGMPEGLLALVRPPVGSQGDVVFYARADASLRWRAGAETWRREALEAGQWLRRSLLVGRAP